MQIIPVDLVEFVAVFMGISIVLVPVIGLTARFALKPTVEALGHFFEHKGLDESVHILERRMALMEQQVESMESSVSKLTEIIEFHHALEEDEATEAALSPSPEEEARDPAAAPTEGAPSSPSTGEDSP